MDSRIRDLQCIMPIANLPSVMEHGILSHDRAARLPHASVAMQPVQDRRDATRVPGGRGLHQYANLYFNARNPMLYKRRAEADGLCVLSVRLAVLSLPGTVITDCNAASPYVRFLRRTSAISSCLTMCSPTAGLIPAIRCGSASTGSGRARRCWFPIACRPTW